MTDAEVEGLVRDGEIDKAAALATSREQWRRAAELLASVGRAPEAVVAATKGREWRLAVEIALQDGNDAVLGALADEVARDPAIAPAAAAQCRLARRDDIAARVLAETAPAEAAETWYARGDYALAAQSYERAGDAARAARAYEQHLAQSPDDVPRALRLADLRATRGDDAGAVRALQAAVRVDATPAVMARLVAGLRRLGHELAARTWVRRLRDIDVSWPVELAAYDERLPRSAGAETRYAGRYRVVREVGSGATGRVMEAVDELTGEPVALKILSVSDDRGAAFSRFMREAELARALDDPTLVRMRALDPEGPTIVYDWMPGGTLAERVGRITLREVRTVVLRVLQALETLHRHGVVHRDVKPANILFDPAGQARLGDLGAAHLGDLGATVTGGLVGSLPYMAPEQITGGSVSASTDLYALGVVMFQLVTGRLPFPGPDFVAQHLGAEVPSACAQREGLPAEFDAVFTQLLAKDQDARPADASAARALVMGLPWSVEESTLASVSSRESLPAAAPGDEAERWLRRDDGTWWDRALERTAPRVETQRADRARVLPWIETSSVIQAVLDLDESGERDVWWLEPWQPTGALRETSAAVRDAVLSSMQARGVAAFRVLDLPVQHADDVATLSFADALASAGVEVVRDTNDPSLLAAGGLVSRVAG